MEECERETDVKCLDSLSLKLEIFSMNDVRQWREILCCVNKTAWTGVRWKHLAVCNFMMNLFVLSTLTPIHPIFLHSIEKMFILCILALVDYRETKYNVMSSSWTWLSSLVKEIIQNSDTRRDCFSYCSLTSQIVCLPPIQSFLYGDEKVDWGWISSLVCVAETGV